MLKKVFSSPYPYQAGDLYNFKLSFSTGLFVFLFLFIFQPFGINTFDFGPKLINCLAYGGITFLCVFLNLILLQRSFPRFFDENTWTFGKQLIVTFWIIFCIGFFNSLYSQVTFGKAMSPGTFLFVQVLTFLVGAIPATLIFYHNRNRYLRMNLQAALEMNEAISEGVLIKEDTGNKQELLVLESADKNGNVSVNREDVVALCASGNYVEAFVWEEETVKRKILRNTISGFEDFFKNMEEFFKVHRSHIVNLKKIKKVTGNSQGMKLWFDEEMQEIPVSRRNIKKLDQKLKKIKNKP